MQWGSSTLMEALRAPFVYHVVADLYFHGDDAVPAIENVPVISAKITADRGSNIRRKLTAEIFADFPSSPDMPFNVFSSKAQLYYGVELGGRTIEYVPMGNFRIRTASRTNRNALAITGESREAPVIEDRFLVPRKPPTGPTNTAIRSLITESVPTARFAFLTTRNGSVLAKTPWDRERWDAISDLAESNGAEVYTDAKGVFVIADAPDLTKPVAWSFDAGPGGVLVSYARESSRDNVYNIVVASGQSSDPAVPAVWAAAYDDNINSPTYYRGPFGRVPRFYSSQFLYTKAQCLSTAQNLLLRSKIPNTKIDFSGTPNPCLEPGDVVEVYYPADDLHELHMIQTLDITIGGTGSSVWSATTLSANDTEGDIEAFLGASTTDLSEIPELIGAR